MCSRSQNSIVMGGIMQTVLIFLLYSLLDGTSGCLEGIVKKREYGCKNQNSQLELYTNITEKPLFGKYYSTLRIEYDDVDSFYFSLEKIKKILQQVIEEVKVNDVDPFLEFYYKAQSSNQSNLVDFFKTYRVNIEKPMSDEALIIEVFQRLQNKLESSIPFLSASMCFCATLTDVPANIVKSINQKATIFPATGPFNYYDRVLGGLKLTYRKTNPFHISEYGILLFNPGDSIPDPIFVMEFQGFGQQFYGPYGVEKKLTYNFLPKNKHFILTTPADYKKLGSSDDWLGGQEYVGQLIYVGEAYCSVIDTTSKYGLLRPEKGERKCFPNGVAKAGYNFSIIPKDKDILVGATKSISPPYFDLFETIVSDILVFKQTKRHRISFQSLNDSKFQELKTPKKSLPTDDAAQLLLRVSQVLGYSRSGLLEKLEKIGQVVNDENFLKQVESVKEFVQKDRISG